MDLRQNRAVPGRVSYQGLGCGRAGVLQSVASLRWFFA